MKIAIGNITVGVLTSALGYNVYDLQTNTFSISALFVLISSIVLFNVIVAVIKER